MTRQFLMFVLVSGVAAAANVGSRVIFGLWLPYLPSIAFAFIVGLGTAFTLNRLFVFRDRGGATHVQAAWFLLVNLGALLLTAVISVVLARWVLPALGVPAVETVAHAIGVAAPAITSYVAHNKWTFRRQVRRRNAE